jgi:23S rRNA pseudouridine1911/1915/1917 synthase
MAKIGCPIVGDRKYGSRVPTGCGFSPGIALHARELVVEHPVQHSPIVLTAPLPESWRRLGFGETTDVLR